MTGPARELRPLRVSIDSPATRIRKMGRTGRGGPVPRRRQCRICLADETWHIDTGSSLDKGICRDRAACETRQPTLDES